MDVRPKRRWYQITLRNLLIALALLPPALDGGWPIVKAAMTPPEFELVTCGHPLRNVSWEDAKRAVEQCRKRGELSSKFQSKQP